MPEFGVKPTRAESYEIVCAAFDELSEAFRLSPVKVEPVRDEFINRYIEKNRHHHDLTHPAEMIATADKFAPVSGLRIIRANLLGMILGHDVVQDKGSPDPDNVAKSRELTIERFSNIGIPKSNILHMASGIDSTANHDADCKDDTIAFFLDDDMSIIGMPRPRYQEYMADIGEEYSHVDRQLFRTVRAGLLSEFKDRPRIYNTDVMHDQFDAQARENLEYEIDVLTGKAYGNGSSATNLPEAKK